MQKSKRLHKPKVSPPLLRFSPYAWAKFLWLRDFGDTEIGGFGICRSESPLLVDDIELVRQTSTALSVVFDDTSVADYFDRQIDAQLHPAQFSRIWLHTHPGTSAEPSNTDEATFQRVFGGCHWALMVILAAEGQLYARLQWNVGPRACLELPVDIDYSQPFAGSDEDAWEAEYLANVQAEVWEARLQDGVKASDERAAWWQREWEEYLQQEQEFRFDESGTI
jgi:proteasome lid subunit RPN8/RPN11